jgi:hypothetical protein
MAWASAEHRVLLICSTKEHGICLDDVHGFAGYTLCVRDEIMSLAVTEGMCSEYPSHNVYSSRKIQSRN